MTGIGHNSGRVIEPGTTWRKYAWARARQSLMPTLPIEVVRNRVKRAKELGLPYRTYAGIRASSGHDLIGFLFSSNALRVFRDGQNVPPERVQKLLSLDACQRAGVVHRPLSPASLCPPLDIAFAAPNLTHSWAQARDLVRDAVARQVGPTDRVLLVGDMTLEREWAEAARMAGYLSADQFFVQV